MYTYQDLLEVGDNEDARMQFALACIEDFIGSPEYKFASEAKQYYEGINPKLQAYQKVVYDMRGLAHKDEVSPNHKIYSRYVFSAITEGTQYLLANGVSFDNEDTKNKLGGDDLDTELQQLLDSAQIYGCAWALWNGERITEMPFLQFVPLKDENTSAVKAGIRFWQIADYKPLRFVLYEIDGYTEYIREDGAEPRVLHPKRDYKIEVNHYDSNIPDEIVNSENFPDFPIIPLYYINQKSIIWGNTAVVDAYDLLNSKMVNNIDEGNLVYWVLRNCNAMDETDDANFIANLIRSHVMHADGDEGASAEPHQIEAPVGSTETGIARIKRLLDENFMTCDTESVRAGNVTATQIKAAYQKLDAKTAKAEYCVIEFLKRLFVVAGIDDSEKFTFQWDRTINRAEEITTILQCAQILDGETITRMLLETLGKVDIVEEVLNRQRTEEMQRFNLEGGETMQGSNEQPTESAEGVSGGIEVAAEQIAGKGLNGIQAQSLIAILGQLAAGSISEGQAVNIIAVTIGVSKEKAREIVNGT